MLTFSHNGLLTPETLIPSSVEEFEIEFVSNLDFGNRKILFEQYKVYCRDLKLLCDNKTITQWIDGSYVTKSKTPSDIDLIFFLDFETVQSNEKDLKQFIYPQSLTKYGVDAYIVVIYPTDHKRAYISNADKAYWMDHFGKTKPNRSRKKIRKGFLEIII